MSRHLVLLCLGIMGCGPSLETEALDRTPNPELPTDTAIPYDTGQIEDDPVFVDNFQLMLDFAERNARKVHYAIHEGVEEEEGLDLWQFENCGYYSGNLDLPTSSGSRHGLDGELSVEWELDFSAPAYNHQWDWQFDIEYDRLALKTTEVTGSGHWTVESAYWDIDYATHTFDGRLKPKGGGDVAVAYQAYFSGNIHWIRGKIGDLVVDWENPNSNIP
ncbi:MAG: hypothetical protein HN348_16055 [Proteobacteria bacterium]|nr:hypothetical protein [Pseudomonadota bacterium]